MLHTLAIVSFGGVVLWEHRPKRDKKPHFGVESRLPFINQLIREVLLEDRSGMKEFTTMTFKLRWSLHNDDQLFVVGMFSKYVSFPFLDYFLKEVGTMFLQRFPRQRRNTFLESSETLEAFDKLVSQYLEQLELADSENQLKHAVLENSNGGLNETEEAKNQEDEEEVEEGEEMETKECLNSLSSVTTSMNTGKRTPPTGDCAGSLLSSSELLSSSSITHEGQVLVTKGGRRIVAGRRRGGGGGTTGSAAGAGGVVNQKNASKKQKPIKEPTNWDALSNPHGVVDKVAEEQHRKGATALSHEDIEVQTKIQKAVYIKRLANGAIAPVNEKDWGEESSAEKHNRLSSWLRSYVGGSRDVGEEDLEKVLPQLREKLISKNVNVEVAEEVCRSVEASLRGKKLGTFESIFSVVDRAMVSSLRRILQPKREINILREVASSKQQQKPYVIVFCGVNGVGKSTSLAKIAYWLQQNNYSIVIAAADTFRHGAVEQLEVHGRCLGVEVYQQGYGTDPSAVAAGAVMAAARQHIDVVLVDTAGRQQNHTSRMRALAKLIHDNQPHLVLFVGEAVVGNNGVDQLRRFNQCLVDFAPIGSTSRGIDGILLTKFDTMDDKVGAAVSMVYELGQPIVFVGVGQTYQDLKVIEPDVVVSALMK